ncbi:MAG: HEAT repeat domain-containing protein, partial [Planctomycetota bacterium]|nr:HEAT repeat domain-containing protein [Planctomycetota bacterium]
VEGAINFLVQTQHPSGGFVYKASPGTVYGGVTQSLTAAGLGSLYLLGDAYGLHGGEEVTKKRKPGLEFLPPSVTMVVEEDKDAKKGNKKPAPVRQIAGFGNAKLRGDQWFKQNFVINPESWTYYYLYGFERYSAFKERAEKINPIAPAWYVGGAKFLKGAQNANGSWMSTNSVDQNIDHSTAFAILFLVRSTKLIIPSYLDIVEGGGNGLPEQGELTFRGGRLVNKTYRQDFDSILSLIETGKPTDWAAFENKFDSLVLSSQKGSRAQQLATLRNLVTNENAVARKVAVKSIGKFRDFDNIPFLIHALSDPEPEIAKLANEGLRFVSRKFKSQKLSAKPNKQETEAIVKFWSKWYLEVVPEGQLLELE